MTETRAQSTQITFGKHRGKTLEEVLATDPQYIQWLQAQDWFRVKFVELHQTIINYGAEPTETPEHNALQVLFLEDDFCLRFAARCDPDWIDRAKEHVETSLKRRRSDLMTNLTRQRTELISYEHRLREDPSREWLQDRINEYQRYVASTEADLSTLPDPGEIVYSPGMSRTFEHRGIDVVLRIRLAYSGGSWKGGVDWFGRAVEIKPQVSDDYPAILRQMRSNESTVLFTRAYTGVGATREQFIKTMNSAGITVVFEDEV